MPERPCVSGASCPGVVRRSDSRSERPVHTSPFRSAEAPAGTEVAVPRRPHVVARLAFRAPGRRAVPMCSRGSAAGPVHHTATGRPHPRGRRADGPAEEPSGKGESQSGGGRSKTSLSPQARLREVRVSVRANGCMRAPCRATEDRKTPAVETRRRGGRRRRNRRVRRGGCRKPTPFRRSPGVNRVGGRSTRPVHTACRPVTGDERH